MYNAEINKIAEANGKIMKGRYPAKHPVNAK
jgi:hypothetical protein